MAKPENQGEGNREAARQYNADTREFSKDKDRVREAAETAKKAVDGGESGKLAQAEKEGLSKARH